MVDHLKNLIEYLEHLVEYFKHLFEYFEHLDTYFTLYYCQVSWVLTDTVDTVGPGATTEFLKHAGTSHITGLGFSVLVVTITAEAISSCLETGITEALQSVDKKRWFIADI